VANYLNKGKLGRITGENVHLLHQGAQGRTEMYTSRGEATKYLDTTFG
jgi:hypothetical protein